MEEDIEVLKAHKNFQYVNWQDLKEEAELKNMRIAL